MKSPLLCTMPAAKDEPPEDLLRMANGQMTEAQYLEQRVDRALAHVKGRVSHSRFAKIRALVIERLQNDPVLIAMIEGMIGRKSPRER